MNELHDALTDLGAADFEAAAVGVELPADVARRVIAEARKLTADLRGAGPGWRRKGPPREVIRKGRLAHRIDK
jgi:hypothetical protein